MSARSVGLDIGTFAVRAAQVAVHDGVVTLERFGQVALPPDAVVAGEVQQPEVVGNAISRLWREARFSTNKVRLGVSGTKVILRQVDFPAMPREELKAALEFEAPELIPIPLEDAYVDFEVLEQFADQDGMRVQLLLAAAHRMVVDASVAAAKLGGLVPVGVDPSPLGIVRALARPKPEDYGTGNAEALLALGEGVTVLVIHQEGVTKFVRLSAHGGGEVTDRLVRELGMEAEAAEDAKRQFGAHGSAGLPPGTAMSVAQAASALAADVRGSIDFYASQPDALPISRMLLTGGASRTAGVFEAIESFVDTPVQPGHIIDYINVGRVGLSQESLAYAEPLMAVPIGIALSGIPGMPGHLNLMPPSVAIQRKERTEMLAAAGCLAGVAVALGGAAALQHHQLSSDRQSVAAHQAQVQTLQLSVSKLNYVAQTQARVTAGAANVKAGLVGQVDWSNVLSQMTTAMPASVWLTSFSGSTPTSTTPGQVTVGAMGLDQKSTSAWLTGVSQWPGISNLYVTSSSRSQVGAPVTISSTGNLTPAAWAHQAQQYLTGGSQG